MNRLFLTILLIVCVACGPRQFTKVHFASDKESNQGRALAIFVIPIDESFEQFLKSSSASEIVTSNQLDQMAGVEAVKIIGEAYDEKAAERKNGVNDFMLVADFANVDDPNREKVTIGDKYYSAKDLYVLVENDRLRLVPKKTFQEQYKKIKGKMNQIEKLKETTF